MPDRRSELYADVLGRGTAGGLADSEAGAKARPPGFLPCGDSNSREERPPYRCDLGAHCAPHTAAIRLDPGLYLLSARR